MGKAGAHLRGPGEPGVGWGWGGGVRIVEVAASCLLISQKVYTISLVFVLFLLFFCFISGVDYIRGEGTNYPRKFDTAPGTRNPGALTAPGSLFYFSFF